jgi:urease beta subunit
MNQTNFGRRVEVRLRTWTRGDDGQKKAVDSVSAGVFHYWGSNVVAKRGVPPVQQTVGLVELEGGRMVRVLPEYVTFTQPMKVASST